MRSVEIPVVKPMNPATRTASREIRRAEKLAQKGQWIEAIQLLDQAMALGADRYTCYLRQARLYQEGRQLQEALSVAEKAIAEAPQRLSAREAIIALHLAARNYELAASASKALLKISPRHVPARDALGAAYIALGNIEGAMRVATELIRLDPSNASHRFNRAHLYQHLGEVQLAIEEFEMVVAISNDPELISNSQEQIEALDALQIRQIVALAFEDSLFRMELLRNPAYAIHSKCYYLSDNGLALLQDNVIEHLASLGLSSRPTLYH